jgi:hypothetical protein
MQNSFSAHRAASEDEEEQRDRDSLLFGQKPAASTSAKATPATSGSSRMVAVAVAVMTVSLSLMVAYYRSDILSSNLQRIGVGDNRGDGLADAPVMTSTADTPLIPAVPVSAKAAAGAGSSSSQPVLKQAGLVTPGSTGATGAYLPPITKTTTTTSATTAMQAKKTEVTNKARLSLLPDINDPDGLHDYILNNYYLYHGFLGDSANDHSHPKAKDDPTKEPETAKGAREAVRTEVVGEQHLFIEAFSDPNCIESRYG